MYEVKRRLRRKRPRSRLIFKRILVPLDGSAQAERALAPTALLARRCQADLMLVGTAGGQWFPGILTSTTWCQTCTIERALKVADALLSTEGIRIETAVLTERPAGGIVSQSELRSVDLLVMATSGRIRLEALVEGILKLREQIEKQGLKLKGEA